jgi:uncharacterized Ntn-hydrolase superfamily protein
MTHLSDLYATYSIVARDVNSGDLGVAVQTHQMGAGRLVPWARPGVGVVATQSLVNAAFGPLGLAMMAEGVPAPRVVEALVASDDRPEVRQFAVVDAQGRAAAWTGAGCIRVAGHLIGQGYSVQANMMVNEQVPERMARAFEAASGDLAGRMMAALLAAQEQGGDIRGQQSAALKVVKGDLSQTPDLAAWETIYDLRVDEHPEPVAELGRLVRLRRAQLIDRHGFDLLKRGDLPAALDRWAEARALAPDLEELPFWQAAALAFEHDDAASAASILAPALAAQPQRRQWIELLSRLKESAAYPGPGAVDQLIAALAQSR